jgi:hypothetical protein
LKQCFINHASVKLLEGCLCPDACESNDEVVDGDGALVSCINFVVDYLGCVGESDNMRRDVEKSVVVGAGSKLYVPGFRLLVSLD